MVLLVLLSLSALQILLAMSFCVDLCILLLRGQEKFTNFFLLFLITCFLCEVGVL